MTTAASLLSIVEYGGYPDFSSLYAQAGYQVTQVSSVRKAIQFLKRQQADVIVAEFNFQSDFRDRTSSLESLLAVVQRWPATRVIIFYDAEHAAAFARLQSRFAIAAALPFPVDAEALRDALT